MSSFSSLAVDFLLGYHGRTRANYSGYLRRWEAWCAAQGLPLLEVRRQDIDRWKVELAEQGLSGNSIRTALGPVIGLYRWATEEGLIERDPAQNVRRPRAPRSSTRAWLDRHNLLRFLAHVTQHADPAMCGLVHLFALSGTRPRESRMINVGDMGRHGDLATVTLRHRKGGASDRITISEPTRVALENARGNRANGPLFVNEATGTRLGKTVMRRRFNRLVEDAGIPHIQPYGLRAGFITLSLDAGIPERDVMISAGHASTAQTAYYDRLRGNINRNATHALTQWLGLNGPDSPPHQPLME